MRSTVRRLRFREAPAAARPRLVSQRPPRFRVARGGKKDIPGRSNEVNYQGFS